MGKEIAKVSVIACLMPFLLTAVPEIGAERLPIKTYTTADGLPRDHINRIVQDSRGFLWFCTSEGLSRFDGYKFTNYGTESGLPSRVVNDFLQARNGFYWVATNGGLCRFIPDAARPGPDVSRPGADASQPGVDGATGAIASKFLVYNPGEDQLARATNAIYEDHAGTIWCSTEHGLYRADQVNGDTLVSFVNIIEPGDPDTGVPLRVNSVTEDAQGSLWILAISGLYRLRPDGTVGRYTADEGLPDATVLLADREGFMWAGSRLGLCQLVPDPKPLHSIVAHRYTVKDGLASDHVTSLCQSSDGTLWIGTEAGMSKFAAIRDEQGGKFQRYTEVNGLTGVSALCEDHDHNLWIGTNSGAMRLAASGFVTYNDADGLGGGGPGGNRVASILVDQAGDLCVIGGSPGVAISRFDGARFTAVPLTLPNVMSYWGWGSYQVTFQDHVGEWWMSTGEGLVRYGKLTSLERITHARPKAIYTPRDGLSGSEIFRLYEDSHGDIWISTLGNALCVMTRWERATETFHRYSLADVVEDSAPTAFCEDSGGNLWIGFYNGGLERYRDGRFTQFTGADGVPPGFIQGFYLDHEGRLWVATGDGGVARVDHPDDEHPAFVAYSTANGLSSNQANSITEDQWGMIYVGTGRGVDRLDPNTGHIRHYTAADGLASNWAGVSFRDRNGSLWFGSLQGLSRLDPQPQRPALPPPVLITALRVAGVPYPISELGAANVAGPELAASRQNVQIEFAGLSFAAGESLRYQYKLDGTSSGWSAPSEERVVTYPNLAPGSYRFLVRAVRSDGTLSQSPASASFTVLPPIWRRWWFLLAACAVLATAAYAAARSRITRMREARESDRRFRTLAETASDAIITIDEHGRIVLANQAAEKTFGHTVDEMLGKDVRILMPEYIGQLHLAGFARYQQTGVRHSSGHAMEVIGLHKNGSEIPLEISFGEFTKDDRRFFTGIARDVSERKRAEEERKQAEAALRRSREERLAELEQVRKRIATDLHDDIGSSLTQISILSEVARRTAGGGDPGGERLAMIARSSRELVDSMSDIVWAINPQKDHLSDLSQRMRRFASDLLTGRNIALEFREPDEENDVPLGANVRRELFLIFKESINNLVRHSGCTEAVVDFQIDGASLNLRVSDNGKGFDASLDAEGHGLASMRQRAQGIGARLKVDARPGQGTVISLELPLKSPQDTGY
jgi:PAS domain S-box-containing protein